MPAMITRATSITTHPAPTLNPELTRSIEVEVPAEEVNKAFQQVTKRYTKLARIPGFRAGKVPASLIKSKFAKEVRQEVLETLVSERFRKALDEQKLQPVSQPQICELQLADGLPLRFKATFEVLPEINIAGYDAMKVEKPNAALERGRVRGRAGQRARPPCDRGAGRRRPPAGRRRLGRDRVQGPDAGPCARRWRGRP